MKYHLTFCLLLFSLLCSAQGEEQKILWKADEKLTWADFQGAPDPRIPYHANTSSGLSFSWSLKTSEDSAEFVYEVHSYFHPMESWVKGEQPSASLLAHEQLHFDISELYVRKLRQQLAGYQLGAEVKEDLNRIYQENEKGRQLMQDRYDRESDHGLEKEAQAKWKVFVDTELLKFAEFSE